MTNPHSKVIMNVNSVWKGSIVVNGMDLSSVVRGTLIVSEAGSPTSIEIQIDAVHLTAEIEGHLSAFIVRADEPGETL